MAGSRGSSRESLEERLLAQSIFSGEVVPEVFTVFAQYKEHAGNKQIIRAYKKWMAYEYLLRGRQLPEELFADYFVDVQKKEDMPCLLAVLKHMSGKAELSEEEAKFADYHVGKLYESKDDICLLPEFLWQDQSAGACAGSGLCGIYRKSGS